MTPDQLRLVGEALYGDLWQNPLAADLNVSDRSIRYWLSGDRPIPEGIRHELAVLCEREGGRLLIIAKALRANVPILRGG